MRITSELPRDRFIAGTLRVSNVFGVVVFGPARARGEADNTNAAEHDNVVEDPTRAYGDHPSGTYLITGVKWIVEGNAQGRRRYGPAFIALDPTGGEALAAKANGRTGIGIHGGALHADGRLRETFGCLRVDDEVVLILARLIVEARERSESVVYECHLTEKGEEVA